MGFRVSVRVELFIEPLLRTQLHRVSTLTISDPDNEFESSCPPFRCVEHLVFSNGRSCHAMVTRNYIIRRQPHRNNRIAPLFTVAYPELVSGGFQKSKI